MASAGTKDAGIGGEAEAPGDTKKNRRRISDYLADNSDGGEAASVPETPPQLIPRFTCARFRFVSFGRKRHGSANKTEDDALVDDSSAGNRSSNSPTTIVAGSKPSAEAGTATSGGSASAEAGEGMGLSVLLLLALARTCVEFNRMAEVRARMEALLKEVRDEASRMKETAARRRHAVVAAPRTFDLRLLSTATSTVSSSSCTSDTDTNHHRATKAKGIVARHECESETGVVELEAAPEFEAEAPARHRPTRKCNAEQGNSEPSSDDDEFIVVRFGGSGDLIKWDDIGDEDSEEESTGDGGVSAAELERRLHELLHRRNGERIEELECALRRAEQRLKEKEMEARLWQDTATLALQRRPPPRDPDEQ